MTPPIAPLGPPRRLRPRLLPTLAAAVLVPALTALGFWQLDRARQKELLKDEYAARSEGPALRIEARPLTAEAVRYYKVGAQGEYEDDYQILLANRIHRRQLGYHVLTPLRLPGGDVRVLVNRGWIPHDLQRSQPTPTRTPKGTMGIEGLAVVPHKNVYATTGPAQPTPGWSRIWSGLDLDEYAAAVPFPVQPFVILLDADSDAGGYVREWRPPVLEPAKNRSYALQWFSMAVAVLVIYLLLGFRRKAPPAGGNDPGARRNGE